MSSTLLPLKLPACERCRKSKIKCDSGVPKCSACTKSSTSCVIIDASTGDRYGREQLHDMQQKLERLEAKKLRSAIMVSQSDASPPSPSLRRTHYVGDGSGSDMFHRVSVGASAVEARAKVLEQLNFHSPRNEPPDSSHDLPSRELARKLVDRYCSHAQLLHPLLSKRDIYQSFDRVYSTPNERIEKQDLYWIFMISAISSVTLFRKGLIIEHPYGFYRSASRLIPYISLIGSIRAIQNLLLIARFATYYHIECSIWDINRLCMQQCIELGLHLPPPAPLPAIDEQLHRNIFWDCYVHDRYSSGILGRPFAISEDDIKVDLPIEADEDQILLTGCQRLDEVDLAQLETPNQASIFRFVIRLRRIISRCQARFFSRHTLTVLPSNALSSAGEFLTDFKRFIDELDDCQQYVPVFPQYHSLYERPEWHQFMIEKDKLVVTRGAFAALSLCGSHLPHKLLVMCLRSATRVIDLYISLFAAGAITWTRSYFQILFTSGLSAIYAMSQLKVSSDDTELNESIARASQAVMKCSELLSRFVSEMPDAGRFAVVFDVLSRPYTNEGQTRTEQAFADTAYMDQVNTSSYSHEPLLSQQSLSALYNPAIDPGQTIDAQPIDFAAFELDVRNLEDWSLFPTTSDNFLGQMEAGMGQYAWGTQHDANAWQRYFGN